MIPRRGERELAIGGNDDVGNEVVVAVKDTLRVTVLVLVASELPDNDRLIYIEDRISEFLLSWIRDSHCVPGHERAKRETNIPRDAVRIMSGFSEEVAMAVIQPLWPAIEPR